MSLEDAIITNDIAETAKAAQKVANVAQNSQSAYEGFDIAANAVSTKNNIFVLMSDMSTMQIVSISIVCFIVLVMIVSAILGSVSAYYNKKNFNALNVMSENEVDTINKVFDTVIKDCGFSMNDNELVYHCPSTIMLYGGDRNSAIIGGENADNKVIEKKCSVHT